MLFQSPDQQHKYNPTNNQENGTYTELFSGGVAKCGFGYFSSRSCVITSESEIHFSSYFSTGTLPSGLILVNLVAQ